MFNNANALAIPEGDVIKIECNGVVLWEKPASYKNWVKYSTEADGVTIYNGGMGYKDGYRVRSGGAEGTNAAASCTGYIPIKAGNIVRLSGYDVEMADTSNAINVFDSAFTNLGQIVGNYPNGGYGIFQESYQAYRWNSIIENPSGVYCWVVPPHSGIAYMRVTGRTMGDGSKMIVTVNEEITA